MVEKLRSGTENLVTLVQETSRAVGCYTLLPKRHNMLWYRHRVLWYRNRIPPLDKKMTLPKRMVSFLQAMPKCSMEPPPHYPQKRDSPQNNSSTSILAFCEGRRNAASFDIYP